MRGAAGRKGSRPGREVAAFWLLALLGGCQWTGDRPANQPPGAPVAAGPGESVFPSSPVRPGPTMAGPAGPQAAAPSSSPSAVAVPVAKDAAGTAPARSELVLTSFRGDPDGPHDASVVASRPLALPEAQPDAPPSRDAARRPDGKGRNNKPPYEVDLSLPSPAAGMVTPTLPPPEKCRPLTLVESLAIAGVENPVIALADQAVQVSRAEWMQAKVLLVPNVNVGTNYDYHDGPLQASFGGIRKVDRQAVMYGFGAYSLAAESVKIPGLFINTPLANAIFNPMVQRHIVANRGFRAQATRNEVLLETATGYLDLLAAEGRLAVLRQSEKDFEEVVRLLTTRVKTGLEREPDLNRARADTLALQYEIQQAQEEVAVASAELARLLNLDPSTRLQTGDVPIQVIKLIDPCEPLPKLLEVALQTRPEMGATAAEIRAREVRVRQEKVRPLLPLLIAGFSADDFGGGATASTNGNVFNPHTGNVTGSPSAATGGQTVPKFGRINGRTDVDVLAVWTLQNFGMGNYAHVKEQKAALGQAQAERARVMNLIDREVSEAYAASAERYRSIGLERRRVEEASVGFQRDLQRIWDGVGLPIELLNQAKRLASARQDLLAAVVGFDRAQFALFVALGQPPTLALNDKPAP